MPPTPARLAVLISGGGRTLLNLLDEIAAGRLPAEVPLVIASRPCAGQELAGARGIETLVKRGTIPRAELESILRAHRIDFVVLAGYLQMIQIPESYQGRIVNIHPALLPDFGGHGMYGDRVHEAVLRSGARESGCTVHLVDDRYDTGPILLQRRCAVVPGDSAGSLAARVFELEKQAYPEAIRGLIKKGSGA